MQNTSLSPRRSLRARRIAWPALCLPAGGLAAAWGVWTARSGLLRGSLPWAEANAVAWPVAAVLSMTVAAAAGLWTWGRRAHAGAAGRAGRRGRRAAAIARGWLGAAGAAAGGGAYGGLAAWRWPDRGPPGGAGPWLEAMAFCAAAGMALVSLAALAEAIAGGTADPDAGRRRGQAAASLALAALIANPLWTGAISRAFAGSRAAPAAERIIGWTAVVPCLSAAFPAFRPDLRPAFYARWRGPMADLPTRAAPLAAAYLAAAAGLALAAVAAARGKPSAECP